MPDIEWNAFSWLCDTKGLQPLNLFHGVERSDPTFIYMGKTGYEVKVLHGNTVSIDRTKYISLQESWQGDVLVFKTNSDTPYLSIPFHRLPEGGGKYLDINIRLLDDKDRYATFKLSATSKEQLEELRTSVETKVQSMNSWNNTLVQAMCAMNCDLNLIKWGYITRLSPIGGSVDCPYCNEMNFVTGKYNLYWLIKCKNCGRQFVAKKRV